ncbi:gp41 [Clostridium phage PhiS63]|uniref:gp41 n=1 Tax=Clostridium phage PhiS63 TaxID=1187894 RepID=UPI00025F77B8|nr:gp41 [Clostridium phage PhiS63]AFJ96096.1 gp41 [Clostridium phage PhiS63]
MKCLFYLPIFLKYSLREISISSATDISFSIAIILAFFINSSSIVVVNFFFKLITSLTL